MIWMGNTCASWYARSQYPALHTNNGEKSFCANFPGFVRGIAQICAIPQRNGEKIAQPRKPALSAQIQTQSKNDRQLPGLPGSFEPCCPLVKDQAGATTYGGKKECLKFSGSSLRSQHLYSNIRTQSGGIKRHQVILSEHWRQ